MPEIEHHPITGELMPVCTCDHGWRHRRTVGPDGHERSEATPCNACDRLETYRKAARHLHPDTLTPIGETDPDDA